MFFSFSHNHIGMMIHTRYNKGIEWNFFKINFISSGRYSITTGQEKLLKKQECRRAHRKLFEVFSLTSSEEEEDLLG